MEGVQKSWTAEAPTAVGCLVVGGGPSGYTAATALAKQGFQNILILERSASSGFFDPCMGFVYSISGPGKAALEAVGITGIDDIGLTQPGLEVKYLNPDGSVVEKQAMMGGDVHDDKKVQSTWMHRYSFNDALYQHIQEHHSDSIKVEFSTKVQNVQLPDDAGGALIVTATTEKDGQESTVRFTCRLLIAADGANSTVRRSLTETQPSSGWDMDEVPSDSSDLMYKVLPLPSNPTLSEAGGKLVNTVNAVIPGNPVDGAPPLRLGLFAVKDLTAPRTANFIVFPDHPFWRISTTDELYKYLEAAFPQLDRLRENIPEAVAQRFVDRKPGSFRAPQTCKRLVAEFPGADEAEVIPGDAAGGVKGASVLMLGDAAHVFPPDIGQGVNAALLDVLTLSSCMARSPENLSAAFTEYEATRAAENAALIRIMQTAAPYQYKQAGKKFPAALWMMNVAFRMLLSKILPQVFFPPVGITFATGSKEHEGPWDTLYRDTYAKGERTTRNLKILGAVAAVAAASFMLIRGFV